MFCLIYFGCVSLNQNQNKQLNSVFSGCFFIVLPVYRSFAIGDSSWCPSASK